MLLFSSLTPTAIDYNPNVRPPCSSPHQWNIQITRRTTFKYTKKTQKNTGVQFKVLVGNWRKLL